MHFKNHLDTDEYCVSNTNPQYYDDLFELENSQAAEQTFRWLGAFGVMVRVMGRSRA